MLHLMKQTGLLAIVFILGCATARVASDLVVPAARAGSNVTTWEYLCSDAKPDEVTEELNKMGAAGWEVASLAPHQTMFNGSTMTDELVICAKRPQS